MEREVQSTPRRQGFCRARTYVRMALSLTKVLTSKIKPPTEYAWERNFLTYEAHDFDGVIDNVKFLQIFERQAVGR